MYIPVILQASETTLVGMSGNGQKVRPKSEVSTAREPIREVAYSLEKITKPIGVSSVGLVESSDLNNRYFASEMTIMKTNRNRIQLRRVTM
jgi:hypothetical protein